MPFWLLQVGELFGAVALADLSLHVARGGLLVAGAGALAVLAVTASGPLGVFRLVGRRLHVTLAAALAVALAVAPVVGSVRPDLEGIIIVEFTAVGLFRLSTLTRVDEPAARRRPAGSGGVGPVIDATATETGPASRTSSSPAGGDRRWAAPLPSGQTGQTGPTGPTSRSAPGAPSGAAARWAGRVTGVAAGAAARSAARHRPAAEEHVKSAIRGAGRLAGRSGRTGGQAGDRGAPDRGPAG